MDTDPQRVWQRLRTWTACAGVCGGLLIAAGALSAAEPAPDAAAGSPSGEQTNTPKGADAQETPARDAPWLRLKETSRRVLKLQLASRTYEPKDGVGPSITLVAAVHVGSKSFYHRLQEMLDGFDVVLYEGVSPAGTGEATPDQLSKSAKIQRTKDRIRVVAVLLEGYEAGHDAYPESIDELAAVLEEHTRQAGWLDVARKDAWGHALVYAQTDEGDGFELQSFGADGEKGGWRANSDLFFKDQKPLTPSELGEEPGIQHRLAQAFGLTFQLDEMDENRPNWRNADMTIDEVQRRLDLHGAGDDISLDLLAGEGIQAHIAAMLLKIMEMMPAAFNDRMRLMLMEMLANSEDIFEMGIPGAEGLMKVLVEQRNDYAMGVLAQTLEDQPELENIAVIYGAGHMPGMGKWIEESLGYEPSQTKWRTAIGLNLERAAIAPSERIMVRGMLLRQLKMMRKMSEREGQSR